MLNSRKVYYEEADEFAKSKGLLYLEASAKSAEKVNDTFLMLAGKIIEMIDNEALNPWEEVI